MLFGSQANAKETTWIPFEATYIAKLNGDVIDSQAKRKLQHLGDHRFRFSALAENLLVKAEEISEFKVVANGIQPQQYQSIRTTPFKKKKEALGFDWDKQELHYQDRKKTGSRQLETDIYDPLSSFYALSNQVKNGAKTIRFKEAKGRKLKSRKYTVEQTETIETPFGKLDTIKLRKQDQERETLVWLAPQMNYLVVKLHQVDDDGDYELLLVDYAAKAPIVFQFDSAQATTDAEPQTLEPESPALILQEDIK